MELEFFLGDANVVSRKNKILTVFISARCVYL